MALWQGRLICPLNVPSLVQRKLQPAASFRLSSVKGKGGYAPTACREKSFANRS
jgi:hypothetical protein